MVVTGHPHTALRRGTRSLSERRSHRSQRRPGQWTRPRTFATKSGWKPEAWRDPGKGGRHLSPGHGGLGLGSRGLWASCSWPPLRLGGNCSFQTPARRAVGGHKTGTVPSVQPAGLVTLGTCQPPYRGLRVAKTHSPLPGRDKAANEQETGPCRVAARIRGLCHLRAGLCGQRSLLGAWQAGGSVLPTLSGDH